MRRNLFCTDAFCWWKKGKKRSKAASSSVGDVPTTELKPKADAEAGAEAGRGTSNGFAAAASEYPSNSPSHSNGTAKGSTAAGNGAVNGSTPTASGSAPTANGSVAATSSGPANGSTTEEPYDLVCIGFGPASLAIAIALHDRGIQARILFLERQTSFAWHSGMLLPGTRMQISFLKDLATQRNPRSWFTFVNYLHQNQRLMEFTNLGTFTPFREEFNDYLTWCAGHFEDHVRYGVDVEDVSPAPAAAGEVNAWTVAMRHIATGHASAVTARNVIVAIGGRPKFPAAITLHPKILHSSVYARGISALLTESEAPYRIAVVGAGQSAAEIFHDLHSRFPNARTQLFLRQHALRPSDDSPFVNEIFNPDRVDSLFELPPEVRRDEITRDKATNYSVVRIELLEELYNHLYAQRLREPDEEKWQHRIRPLREVVGTEEADGGIRLKLRNTRTGEVVESEEAFDAVICATGYARDVHLKILKPVMGLMKKGACTVGRDYRVQFRDGAVARDSGIFLQGCCEDTHGVGFSSYYEARGNC
jgi:L-ornithine N5-oxygenase